MYTLFFVLIAVMLVVAFVIKEFSGRDNIVKTEKSSAFDKLLYRPRKFLTDSELNYFRTIEERYGTAYYIVPQVLLSSIVDVDMPSKFYAYRGYRSKIDKKTLDFVLFDKVSFMPVLAIELDDKTHTLSRRIERDTFVNAVMEKVGIKIERVKN